MKYEPIKLTPPPAKPRAATYWHMMEMFKSKRGRKLLSQFQLECIAKEKAGAL